MAKSVDSITVETLSSTTEPLAPTPPPVVSPALRAHARRLVRDNAATCAVISFVPARFLGSVGISALQLRMLAELSELYGVPFSQNVARSLVAASVGGVLNSVLARNPVSHALRDWVNVHLSVIALPLRLLTGPVLMAAYTYILGNAFVRHYEKGGAYLDFDWQLFRYELASKLGLPRPLLLKTVKT